MAEVRSRIIRKFNPGTFQSDKEVITQFVVRNRELDVVLETLRGNMESPSCQHILVVAPRGQGKTMLLARVAAELRTRTELSEKLLPVRFMEESQEIFDIADFWLETLFHLAREISGLHPEFAAELRETHGSLSRRWREQSTADVACAAVLEAAQYLDRRLVLMVENLQTLSEDVDQDFGWNLRKVLQTEPQIMLVASATSRFESLDTVSEPFYELFRIIYLNPLDTEECRRLWKVVSGDAVTTRDIRPLEILTGGSPRLLIIVGGLEQHRSLRRLMEDLVKLIDDHTEYFRSHLEGMGKTERRVYVALIDLWQLSAPGEVAARARMDIRKVSTMLGRLFQRGAVIRKPAGRKWMYVASERLYCIYYKLRRERGEAHIVRNLIRFMVVFYSEAELTTMFQDLKLNDPSIQGLLEGIMHARNEFPVLNRILSTMRQNTVAGLSIEDMAIADRPASVTGHTPPSQQSVKQISDLVNRGRDRLNAEDMEGAMRAFNEVIERCWSIDAEIFQQYAAEALICVAGIHLQLGEFGSASSAFERIIARFGTSDSDALQTWVAAAFNGRGASRSGLGDEVGAISDYDEVIERYGAIELGPFQQSVAHAWIRKAAMLRAMGDLNRAASTYEAFLERFEALFPEMQNEIPDLYDQALKRQVAEVLLCLGSIRIELKDLKEASKVFGDCVRKFRASDEVNLQKFVAGSLYNRGNIQSHLGDLKGAIGLYGEVLQLVGKSDASELQLFAAMSLINWGGILRQQRDWEGAISKCDEVVERYGTSHAAALQEQVLLAMLNRGGLREESEDLWGAIKAYKQAVDRFGANDAADVRSLVVRVLLKIATIAINTRRPDLALQTCAEISQKLQLFADEQHDRFAWQELHLRIRALVALDRLREAMHAFRNAYDVFLHSDEVMIRELPKLVTSLVNAGALAENVLAILTADKAKAAAITPLLAALRLHAGEAVRAPEEVLQVAKDILDEMNEHTKP